MECKKSGRDMILPDCATGKERILKVTNVYSETSEEETLEDEPSSESVLEEEDNVEKNVQLVTDGFYAVHYPNNKNRLSDMVFILGRCKKLMMVTQNVFG